MIIDWFSLIVAALVLWPPLPFATSLRRMQMDARSGTITIGHVLKTWQHWLDFARAAVAVFVLTMAVTVAPEPEGSGMKVLAVKTGVIGIGLLLQIVRWKESIQFFMPVAYLTGIALLLPGSSGPDRISVVEGGFPIVVGWFFALMGGRIQYALPITAVALGISGYVLGISMIPMVLTCGLLVFPWFMAFLFQKDLLVITRARSVKATESAVPATQA